MTDTVWVHTHPDGSREVVLLPPDIRLHPDLMFAAGYETAAVVPSDLVDSLAKAVNALNRNLVFRQHIGAEFDPTKSHDAALEAIRLIRGAGLLDDESAVLPGDVVADQRQADDESDEPVAAPDAEPGHDPNDEPQQTDEPGQPSESALCCGGGCEETGCTDPGPELSSNPTPDPSSTEQTGTDE